MDDIHKREDPSRYVPHGVDPQSWLGFEQRIQDRRYRALLQQIEHAIVRGDSVAARVALEEARELRPDASDLNVLDERVAGIGVAFPVLAPSHATWSRPMRAVTMLAAGVALVIGIEWIRPPRPLLSTRPVTTSVATLLPAAPSTFQTQDATPAGSASDAVARSTEPDVAIPDVVATAGVEPAINIPRPAVGGPAPATFRPAALIEGRVPESAREVRDVDASADARGQRETYPDSPEVAAASSAAPETSPAAARIDDDRSIAPERVAAPPALVASLAPVPTPIGIVSPTVPTPAAIEARSRVTEESRVSQVIDQYARAYGQLDVRAAQRIWPTVDERALARAFAGLQSQDVSFENCNVSVNGTTATASCRGRSTYVGKIGSREKKTEARQWTFELRRDANDAWQIERAQAQRMVN